MQGRKEIRTAWNPCHGDTYRHILGIITPGKCWLGSVCLIEKVIEISSIIPSLWLGYDWRRGIANPGNWKKPKPTNLWKKSFQCIALKWWKRNGEGGKVQHSASNSCDPARNSPPEPLPLMPWHCPAGAGGGFRWWKAGRSAGSSGLQAAGSPKFRLEGGELCFFPFLLSLEAFCHHQTHRNLQYQIQE